jgi:fibronectin-binding autotransporter adhesin
VASQVNVRNLTSRELSGCISIPVNQQIILAGPPAENSGKLVSVSGNNVLEGAAAQVTVDAATTIQVDSGSTLTFQRGLATSVGDSPITKTGGGVLILEHNNNQVAGTTTINNGTLLVNGTLSSTAGVAVTGRGITGGSGTVSAATLSSGGTVSPGNSPGILTMPSLTAASGTSLSFEINGATPVTQHDQIVLTTGPLTLNSSALSLSLGMTPALGDSWRLISVGSVYSISGTFDGLPEGAIFPVSSHLLQIYYLGGDGNPCGVEYASYQ